MYGGEETSREGGGGGILLKLKSFIHEHPLTLSDGLLTCETCNECGLHISGPGIPTFSCTTCKYFIHKSCVELPFEIDDHSLHRSHRLKLAHPPCPPAFNGIFFCEICNNVRHDGFSYYCPEPECHFALDSHCALNIPAVLRHLTHEHPFYVYAHGGGGICRHCKDTTTSPCFRCAMAQCWAFDLIALDFNCAFLPPQGKHKAHLHQLKLQFFPPMDNHDQEEEEEEEEYYCDACEELRSPNGLFYYCADCDFTAHTSCVFPSPFQLFPPSNSSSAAFKDGSHDHILTLMPPSSIKCQVCAKSQEDRPYYRCEDCNYNIHVRCATQMPSTRGLLEEKRAKTEETEIMKEKKCIPKAKKIGRMMDIKKSHQHPLEFSSDMQWNSERCNVCRLPISGANYSCTDCKFFLHELCTKLPNKIEHEIHSQHPLLLAPAPSPPYLNSVFLCEICSTPGDGFSYHCPECWSVCHVDCALKNKPTNLTHKCHEHQLTLTAEMITHLPCCACQKKVDVEAYYCCQCDIAVGVECALLPKLVNHDSHPHPLNLTEPMMERFCCGVCGKEREWKGWAYYCGDCKFMAHTSCICEGEPSPYIRLGETTLKHPSHNEHLLALKSEEDMSQCSHCNELIQSKFSYQCPGCNYNLDLGCALRLTYAPGVWMPQGEGEGGREMELEPEIEHFSHLHPLALLDEQTSSERCNGCRLAISDSALSYGCRDCKFYLHKSCLELPQKIMFSIHREHPLSLSVDPPPPLNSDIFYCSICATPGDGFSFNCTECRVFLHVHCALCTPMQVRHASHEHLLTLSWRIPGPVVFKCDACKSSIEGAVFKCCECDFTLHVPCALQFLPPTLKHKSHRHDLTLLYSRAEAEEESDEYYCDACEEERDPNTWVYCCCEKCDFVAHASCDRAAEPFPFIKLGGIRRIESHDHPLTLVVKKEDIHRRTDNNRCLSGLLYQCTDDQCGYKVDFLETPYYQEDDE